VSDESSAGIWAQVGYYICNGSTPVAFYQIWNLNSGAVLTTGTSSVSAGTHTFSMYLQGGTVWAYAVDGAVIGTYDMGSASSSSSYPVYAMSEEGGVASAFQFSPVTFSTAMDVYVNGGWQSVATASSYGSGWGVQGNLQNGNLGADEIVVGGYLPTLSTTSLWSSAGSATSSTISSSVSTSTSLVTSQTTSQGNGPIASVALSGPTTASVGPLSQYLAQVYVNSGSAVGVQVSWYVDGILQWSDPTGPSGGAGSVGWSWFNEYWAGGTHTIYAVAGGVQSSVLTVYVGSGSTTTTTDTSTSTSTTTSTTTVSTQSSSGGMSIALSGPTSGNPGALGQYLASVSVASGSPLNINVDWYVDGSLQWSELTGASGSGSNVGWAWFNEYWAGGTHTIYAIAGGVQSSVLTVYVGSGSTTTTTTTTSTTTSQPTTGVTSVALSGPTIASAGTLSQYLAQVYVSSGSPVGINVSWYVDGILQWSDPTGTGSGPTPVGWAWFNEFWTSGTHTIYAIAGGVQSNTIYVVAY